MLCKIRKWEISDAANLANALSIKKIQDNLRDGLPYPYTENDGSEFIKAMLAADDKIIKCRGRFSPTFFIQKTKYSRYS